MALSVLFNQQLVGSLDTENRVLQFQYSSDWLGSENAFPLSPTLPLREEMFEGEQVPYFFSNLLPEGRILSTILKLKRLPEGDIFAQLMAFGEESAGAFSIVPDNQLKERTPHYLPYTRDMLAEDLKKVEANVPLLTQHGELRLSLAGAQNKITVHSKDGQFLLPAGGAPSTVILKPPIEPAASFPDSVWNEALCLGLGRMCGIGTVDISVIQFAPKPFLAIRRYDRIEQNDLVLRLHQLDFCQLAGLLPDQKYEHDGGPSIARMAMLIQEHVTVPAPDKSRLLDWIVFNYIVGNSDGHAKNAAVLVETSGRRQLSPFYDILSTAVYPELQQNMAMAIGGEYRPDWVRAKNWKNFCTELGINSSLLRKRSLQLSEHALKNLNHISTALGIQDHAIVRKMGAVIKSRAAKIEIHQAEAS